MKKKQKSRSSMNGKKTEQLNELREHLSKGLKLLTAIHMDKKILKDGNFTLGIDRLHFHEKLRLQINTWKETIMMNN